MENPLAPSREELTDKQLYEMCEVTRQTTRNWRIDGLPYRKRGKFIYYDRATTEAWMRDRIVKTILSEGKSVLIQRLDKRIEQHRMGPKAAAEDIIRNTLDKLGTLSLTAKESEVAQAALMDAKQFVIHDYAAYVLNETAYDIQYIFWSMLFIPDREERGISENALFVARQVISTLYPDFLSDGDTTVTK